MGVHGAGKTTLTYILSAHFKMKDCNVKLIHESVRENCPFPINADANQGTCLWNFHTQFLNELDAEAQGYQLAICDRSVLDTFVYFHAVNPENAITRAALEQAAKWLVTYDLLICLEPSNNTGPVGDGIRDTNRDYQLLIRDGFRKTLEKYGQHVAEKTFFATSDDIFRDHQREKLIAQIDQKLVSMSST
jgi:thymidylate kinase